MKHIKYNVLNVINKWEIIKLIINIFIYFNYNFIVIKR